MEAIVLAAGGGRRFAKSGGVGHKGLHPIAGSCTLESTVSRVLPLVSGVTVVTGFARDAVEARLRVFGPVSFVHSPRWATTDSAHSFAVGASSTTSDVLLVYADTVVTPSGLQRLALAGGDAVGIDVGRPAENWDMRAVLDGERVVRLSKKLPPAEAHAEASCVYRLSAVTVRALAEVCLDDPRQLETVLDEHLGTTLPRLNAVDITSMWAELDRMSDHDLVRSMMGAA